MTDTETEKPAETEPPAPKQSSVAGRRRGRKSGGAQVRNEFRFNNLYGGNFGVDAPRRIATALKKTADVDAELKRYVPPACFGRAADRLRQAHVVVLGGARGLGRYTSALALLREVVDGDLVPISPTVTFQELHGHAYEAGRGYYVLDHTAAETGAEAEFLWNAACTAVKNAKAFLVITTTSPPRFANAVNWQRPDLADLVRALLGPSAGRATPKLLARVPPDWSPTDMVEFCSRLCETSDDESALGVFDLTATAEVRAWFDDPVRDWTDFVEVAALAFAGSAGMRDFESMATELERRVQAQLPETEESEEDRKLAVMRTRQRRRHRSSLICEERTIDGGFARQKLAFRSPSHRLQVVEALWATQSVAFWDGVQDWLLDMIEDLDDEAVARVAEGVALLAQVSAEEAVDKFLEPMAALEADETGLVCASNVLRLMALDESLAPTALQIAVGWISGTVPNRLIAGEALMTELGVRYPADASKRLWQLISQDELLDEFSYQAPAMFAQTLVELDGDALPLLELLKTQLDRIRKPPVTMRMTDLVLRTVQELLSRRSDRTGQLVSFELLLAHPETAGLLGRLWAGVLINRRFRAGVLAAMWDGMFAAADRDRMASVLTDALSAVLDPDEQDRFVQDFTVIDRRKRQNDPQRRASLAHLLIDAMARIHGNDQEKAR